MSLNFGGISTLFKRSREVDEGISRLIDETTSVIWSGAYTGIAAGTLNLFPTGPSEITNENKNQMLITKDGILRNLSVDMINTGGSAVFTVMKNKATTDLTVSIPTDGTHDNFKDEIPIKVGDTIAIRSTNTGGSNNLKWSFEFKQF